MPQYEIDIQGKVNRSFEASIERLERELRQLDKEQGRVNKGTRAYSAASAKATARSVQRAEQTRRLVVQQSRLNQAQNNLATSIAKSRAAYAAFGAVITGTLGVAIAGALDKFTSLRNRLVAVGTGGEEARKVIDSLSKTASLTGTNVAELGGAFSRFKIALDGTNATSKEITNIIDSLAKSSAALGLEASEVNSAILQLGQAMASGRLQGDEFRSVAENLPVLLQAIQAETGKSAAELKEFASQGGITTKVLRASLLRFGADAEKQFKNFQQTIGGALKAVRGAVSRLVNDIAQRFGAGGIGDLIQRAAVAVNNFRISLSNADSTAARVISGTFNTMIVIVNTLKLGFNSLHLAVQLTANSLAGLLGGLATFSLEPIRAAFEQSRADVLAYAEANQKAASSAQAAWSKVASALSGQAVALPSLPSIPEGGGATPAATGTGSVSGAAKQAGKDVEKAGELGRLYADKTIANIDRIADAHSRATEQSTIETGQRITETAKTAATVADRSAERIGNSMVRAVDDITRATGIFGQKWSSVMSTAITEIGRLIVQAQILKGVQTAASFANPTAAAVNVGASVLSTLASGAFGLTGEGDNRLPPQPTPPRPAPTPLALTAPTPQVTVRPDIKVAVVRSEDEGLEYLGGNPDKQRRFILNAASENDAELRQVLGIT